MIQEQVEAELRLISDLLDVTRALQGKLSTVLTRCSIHSIIRKAIMHGKRRSEGAPLCKRGETSFDFDNLRLSSLPSPLTSSSASLPNTLGNLNLVTHLDAPADIVNVDPVRMNQVCGCGWVGGWV